MSTEQDVAVLAKGALERVCSSKALDPASRYYSESFIDHVNDLEYRGLEGAPRLVEMYTKVRSDISVRVEEQVVEGNRLTSRFVVTGRNRGRTVRFNRITISRFEDDKIIEDWSVTDTLGTLRQLGTWRSVMLGIEQWRSLKEASQA